MFLLFFFFSFFILFSLRAETYVFAVRRVAWTLRFTRGHSRRYTVSTTFLCNRHFRSFRMPIAARLMATLVRVQNRFITSDLWLRTISIDYAIHSSQHLYRFTLSLHSFSYTDQFYELIDTKKQWCTNTCRHVLLIYYVSYMKRLEISLAVLWYSEINLNL